jgi:ribosomal protein L37AE/L43A
MTREDRTENVVCPACDNNPIIRGQGVYFCDCCNQEFRRADLVQMN